MADFHTEYEHTIICPYCGHEHDDPDEFFHVTSEDAESECSSCDEPISITRNISVTYSARKMETQARAATAKFDPQGATNE